LWIAAVAMALAGCATTSPEAGFDDVARTIEARSGAIVVWNRGSGADAAVAARVDNLLGRELSVDSAVQIALLNNSALQARYEALGIAQADLVEAGLLKNPVFDASLRWPDRGGPNVELAVAAGFLDVLFIPAKKKIAAAQLEQAKREVGGAVLALAAEVRAAVYELEGARQMLGLRESMVAAAASSADVAMRMRQAGNISALDQDSEQAMYEQAALEQMRARAQVQQARERLAALMGMSGREFKVADHLPDIPAGDSPLEALLRRALAERLDVGAAREHVRGLGGSLGLSKAARLLSGGEIGVDSERETSGQRVTGPTFSLPIPLFDFGQASVARAQARLRQARAELAALMMQVRSEVRQAHARLIAARERAERYVAVVLPLQRRIVDQSQLHYNGMLLGFIQLIQAKQNQINTEGDYVEALRDYWIARSDLERAAGGRLAVSAATQPASAPAAATAPAEQPAGDMHHHH
jgi:cobalt-zinc-cadmium efflux system outer membrane protein